MATETSYKIVEQALEGSLEEMRTTINEALDALANGFMDEMKIEIANAYFGQGYSPLMEARKSDKDGDSDDKDDDEDEDDDKDCKDDDDSDDDDEMDESINEAHIKRYNSLASWKKAVKDKGYTHEETRKGRHSVASRHDGANVGHFNHFAHSGELVESPEEVNELSKDTLGSYISKARTDRKMHGDSALVWKKDSGERSYHQKKALNRQSGEILANKKLTKESTEEVNELSKKTLGSYVSKSAEDLDKNAYVGGRLHKSGTLGNSYTKKASNRVKGIQTATKKLTKEDTVDERDEGKPGKNFNKIANKAAKEYGSKAAGERVAGAIRAKLAKKHPSEYHE